MAASAAASGPGRHLRADAARNRQRLIEAAAEVFAARGLDATLDEIARHAGVNVATAYRNFSSKHELAREFLQRCVDQAAAIAEETARAPDPWEGLEQFLARSLDQVMSNRALIDLVTHAHDFTSSYRAELFDQLQDRISGPLEHLLARGRDAGVVRADIAVNDFPPMLHMLSSIADAGIPGIPELPRRYISLMLAGLRPGPPLHGKPPTRDQLRAAAAHDAGATDRVLQSTHEPRRPVTPDYRAFLACTSGLTTIFRRGIRADLEGLGHLLVVPSANQGAPRDAPPPVMSAILVLGPRRGDDLRPLLRLVVRQCVDVVVAAGGVA